jgi:hypothetical protein
MAVNVGSVPILDDQHHLKAKHLDVPTAGLVGTPASATAIAVQALIQAAVTAVVAAAPGQLNTLKELADALGDDANFGATVTAALAAKADAASVAATYSPLPTAGTTPGYVATVGPDGKSITYSAATGGGGLTAADNGLGGITTSSTAATDNGLGGIAA